MNRRERRLKQRVAEVTRRLTETDQERHMHETREWLEQMAARRQEHRRARAELDAYDAMLRQAK